MSSFLRTLVVTTIFISYSLQAKLIQSFELNKNKIGNVLIFISKDCPCSKGNLSYVDNLSIQFPNYQFIGIHSKKNSSNDEVLHYIQDKNLHFDVYNDFDLKLANTYKALKTPHAFILKGNEVVYNGGITNTTMPDNAKEHFLKEALLSMTKTGKPDRAETRTLGCFIVR